MTGAKRRLERAVAIGLRCLVSVQQHLPDGARLGWHIPREDGRARLVQLVCNGWPWKFQLD